MSNFKIQGGLAPLPTPMNERPGLNEKYRTSLTSGNLKH